MDGLSLSGLFLFNVTLLAAWISPGPAFLVTLRTTLTSGPRAGIAVAAGLGLMAAAWTAMALLGLEAVFVLFPWAYSALRILGALYLLWLAVTIWRGADAPVTDRPGATGRAFRTGLLVNLGNPKSVLFAGAVLVVVFPSGTGIWAKAVIVANHLALELCLYTVLVWVLSRPAVARSYLGAKRWFDRAAAVILGALGLRLLAEAAR